MKFQAMNKILINSKQFETSLRKLVTNEFQIDLLNNVIHKRQ
jgi:hypothetical protein